MLSLLQQRKLTHLFRILDVDESGYLELADYERTVDRIARGLGWSEDAPERAALRAQVLSQWAALLPGEDPPGSGKVSLEGWIALWNALLNGAYEERVQGISELLWRTMDRDGDGRITREESRLWFEFYGMPPDAAHHAFRACDLDGDGVVSREEWMLLVDEFFLSMDPDAPGNRLFGPIDSAPP